MNGYTTIGPAGEGSENRGTARACPGRRSLASGPFPNADSDVLPVYHLNEDDVSLGGKSGVNFHLLSVRPPIKIKIIDESDRDRIADVDAGNIKRSSRNFDWHVNDRIRRLRRADRHAGACEVRLPDLCFKNVVPGRFFVDQTVVLYTASGLKLQHFAVPQRLEVDGRNRATRAVAGKPRNAAIWVYDLAEEIRCPDRIVEKTARAADVPSSSHNGYTVSTGPGMTITHCPGEVKEIDAFGHIGFVDHNVIVPKTVKLAEWDHLVRIWEHGRPQAAASGSLE